VSRVGALALASTLLAATALAAAARLPGFDPEFAWAFAVAAGLRLALGLDGRRLLPRRALTAVAATLAALVMAWLLLVSREGTAGPSPLVAFLAVGTSFQALCLLARQGGWPTFLVILLSSTSAVGAAFVRKDATALALAAAYVGLLVWTLVLRERAAEEERAARAREGTARRLRLEDPSASPRRALALCVGRLVLTGFAVGLALYLVAPRELGGGAGTRRSGGAAEGRGDAADGARGADAAAVPGGITGPDEKAKVVRWGAVGEIKRNLATFFEVEWLGGVEPSRVLYLREDTMDAVDPDGDWQSSADSGKRPRGLFPEEDGTVHRGGEERGATRDLKITFSLGGNRRLYLEPEVAWIRALRAGQPLRVPVFEHGDASMVWGVAVEPGDVVYERSVPQPLGGAALEGRASDPRVAPLASYTHIPARDVAPLRRLALQVVGAETDPWRRAVLLADWLRSSGAFTYTLRVPELDKRNRILDFLLNVRRGHCECYATALAWLLRSLDHPSRYVRGFWGGDWLKERRAWVFRGSHYHAWTEIFLEGVGWVPLNPTPADSAAADIDTVTREAGRSAAAEDADADGGSFLDYGPREREAVWRSVKDGLARLVAEPARWLFGSRGGFLGVPLLLGAAWWLRRRASARASAAEGRTLSSTPVPGPYGAALRLLARNGVRRRPSQTPSEFGGLAAAALPPEPGRALARLTSAHERQRYAGAGDDAALAREADGALEDLRKGL
jgi:hypothetical protein